MKASKKVKGEAIALVVAIVLVVLGAFLVKYYFYGEPVSEDVKIVGDYQQETSPNKIKISEVETDQEIVTLEFNQLETEIKNIETKVVKTEISTFKSEIFAVKDADYAEFQNATITLSKKGNVNYIAYCEEFDFENELCKHDWERTAIPFTQTETLVTFTVEHFSAYAVGTDVFLKIEGNSRPANHPVPFIASFLNTSDLHSNKTINNTQANITINFTDGLIVNMTFNESSNRWEYNRTFGSDGTYYFTVQTSSDLHEDLNATDSVDVFNCVVPQEGTYINNDTPICSGEYVFSNTVFIINTSNVTLNCNGARINSTELINSSGYSNVTIKNCHSPQYNYGRTSVVTMENGGNLTLFNINIGVEGASLSTSKIHQGLHSGSGVTVQSRSQ